MELKKATRKQVPLKIGLSGPSGSGKTYSALLIARGLSSSWEKIAVIDTENGSADLYSHLGAYNTLTLDAPYSPERYIEAIETCEKAGIETIIIDSTTHEWDGKGGCLEINETIAQTKFRGNTWSAWSVTTPRHQAFINKITGSKCHVITTVRSKTDTVMTEDKKIKKVGLKEIQREGFEYELTISFTLDREKYLAVASKDRTGIFTNIDPFLITEETGKKLLDWSNSGAVEPKIDAKQLKYIQTLITKKGADADKIKEAYKITSMKDLTIKDYEATVEILKARPDVPKPATNDPQKAGLDENVDASSLPI